MTKGRNRNGVPFKRTKNQKVLYAFVDETGHTGMNVFDLAQPVFTTWAVLSRTNLDKDADFVEGVKALNGGKELHATKMTEKSILSLLPSITEIIERHDLRFAKSTVDKSFHVARQIMERCADPDNLAPLAFFADYRVRSVITRSLYEIAVELGILNVFWDAMREKDKSECYRKFSDFCGSMADAVEKHKNPIVRAAWIPMVHNQCFPDKTDIFIDPSTAYGKAARAARSPNCMGFLRLMLPVDNWAKTLKCEVVSIKHDEQIEMKLALYGSSQIMSQMDMRKLYGIPTGVSGIRIMCKHDFAISDSRESQGIQLVDIIMAIDAMYKKSEEHRQRIRAFIDLVYGRGYESTFDWSTEERVDNPDFYWQGKIDAPKMLNARRSM